MKTYTFKGIDLVNHPITAVNGVNLAQSEMPIEFVVNRPEYGILGEIGGISQIVVEGDDLAPLSLTTAQAGTIWATLFQRGIHTHPIHRP